MTRQTGLRLAFATYIILLHAALLILVFKTDFLLLAGKTLGLVQAEEWTPNIVSDLLKQAEQDAAVPPGRVALIGDSMMAGLRARLSDIDAVNYGISGDTTHTLYSRLPVIRSVQDSKAVVIEIGVNDLRYRTLDQIGLDYDALFSRLTKSSAIFVLSVLPVDETGIAARQRGYLRNATIAALNRHIRNVCAMHSQCRFLDAWPVMLNKAVYSADGWHLSSDGNQVLADVIRNELASPP